MGVDVRIYIKPHASAEKIFEVILKTLGHEFQYKYFDGTLKPDFNLPCGDKNRWYLKPIEDEKNKLEPETTDYFNLQVKDCANNIYQSLIHLDCEESDYPICKLMSPRSSGVWCAVGKRLVDFFGGKIVFSDCSDENDPKNYYECKKGKYPPKRKDQDGNDRWYQYYNALNSEPILIAKEILDMRPKAAYWNDRDDSLVFYLDKCKAAIELEKKLRDDLKENSTNKSKSKKIKL